MTMTDPLPDTAPNVTCPVCKAPPGYPCRNVIGDLHAPGHGERLETTPTYDALTSLADIRATWLRECGACDAGMATACVCAEDDPRTVILALVNRVETAEARLDAVVVAARG